MDFRTMLKKKKYAKNVQDDGGPDWGGLKHVDREEGEEEEGPKKVNDFSFLILYQLYYICTKKYCIIDAFGTVSLLTDCEEKFGSHRKTGRLARLKASKDIETGNFQLTFFHVFLNSKKAKVVTICLRLNFKVKPSTYGAKPTQKSGRGYSRLAYVEAFSKAKKGFSILPPIYS